jgi:hypothetical protein
MSVVVLKVSEEINAAVTRDQSFTSISIDMVAQNCLVKRTSVLTWGSEETSFCTSTSYDDVVIDGYDFDVLMTSIPDPELGLSRYDGLAQAIHDVIALKGI